MKHVHRLNGEAFEWNVAKAASNVNKHGITFEEACEVFMDPFLKGIDASNEADSRHAVVGYDGRSRLLLVVYVEPDGDAIRIISARTATSEERRFYERE